MNLINLNINRIIIHQVFQREPDGSKKQPLQSHEYTNFDANAMNEFKARVREALGDGSKAVPMEIVNNDSNGLPCIVEKIINQNDDDFAASSYDIAKKLADAQHRKSIPGGIVVIFTGTQGQPQKRFLGIIKAEIHSGYEKEVNEKTKEISLKFVEELLLTPGTKLYKTAAFFEKEETGSEEIDLNKKWAVLVSDYQINQAEGKAAAQYFYADFLGFGYPKTSARTTMLFHEKASTFIEEMEISAEKKNDLHNALTTYLKVGLSSAISSEEFAENYFDIDTQDAFMTYMEECGIPTSSFTKDIKFIEGKLKFRKINFSKNIKISAPSEIFKELITIESITGDPDEAGNDTEWTKVIIKDKISEQE